MLHVTRTLRELHKALQKSQDSPRTRLLAYAVGTFLIILGCVVIAHGYSAKSIREARATSDAPSFTDNAAEANFSLDIAAGSYIDNPVMEIAVDVTNPLADPPPGLSRWPSVGHVAVSPALADDLKEHDPSHYGLVDEIIDVTGVDTPNERRVYLRVPNGTAASKDYPVMATGFGRPSTTNLPTPMGTGSLYAPSLSIIMLGAFGLLIVPGLACIALGGWGDSTLERRKAQVLKSIGLRTRTIAALDTLHVAKPVAWSSITILIGYAILCFTGVRIRSADLYLYAGDLRSGALLVLASALIGALLSTGAVALIRAASLATLRSHDPAVHERVVPTGALIALGAAALGYYAPITFPPVVGAAVFGLACVTCLATMKSLVRESVRLVGLMLNSLARWSSSSTLLVAARTFLRAPSKATGIAFAFGTFALLAGLVSLWATTFSSEAMEAHATRDTYGDGVYSTSQVHRLDSDALQRLPGTPLAFSTILSETGELPTTLVYGTCTDLTSVGLPCDAPLVDLSRVNTNVVNYLWPDPNTWITRTATWDQILDPKNSLEIDSVSFVAQEGQSFDLTQAQAKTFEAVPGGLVASNWVVGWILSSEQVQHQAYLISAAGLLALVGLGLSLAYSLNNDTEKHAATLSLLSVMTTNIRWAQRAQFACTVVPIAMAGALATILYNVLPTHMKYQNGQELNWTPTLFFTLLLLSVTVIVALVTGIISARRIQPIR